jgi:molybdate-binding protein/DNA-binding transcriptional regulator YhcF (GntR family)
MAETELIQVDPARDVPVYIQIADQVRVGVATGRFKPGDRLEPVRALARRLAVNPSTVAHAYQLLEHEGIIRTNRRGGSLIAPVRDDSALEAMGEARLRGMFERLVLEARALGYSPERIEAAFNLQMAAWRERGRLPRVTEGSSASCPTQPQTAEGGCVLTFAGSHDLALEALWAHARQADPGLTLRVNYVGSLDGLLALMHGEALLAGAHILDEASGEYNLPILRRLFVGQPLRLVTLAEREQGLIVARGNPLGIAGLADLVRPDVRFSNRQMGSGTRTLLDYHLLRAGLDPHNIVGYETAAPTHMAVAAAVAEGRAGAGLGLVAAARAFGLGFIPLARERYDLVVPEAVRDATQVKLLLNILAQPEFCAMVRELGGYDTSHTGEERQV